ncbi:cytidylyltransferase domain-containing protein [Ensifer sp. ENS11]|uniref:acylneuraminate cytidylyltransferase family protein n=1 Tax=Ensifer sp. ENS11 TaxID=2769291 RepID=UPI00177D2491|nr:NTP transferase domain-containing protein [Ensifer sp. ENS11]MBD9491641.1 NTP transferase domain-containing protein [Ensifer sp. ENS11]
MVAIIPAKGVSRRVHAKNLRMLGGMSLIERKIKQLASCNLIDQIIVGSDSDDIRQITQRNGAEYLNREPYFCDESRCSANEMIEDLVSRVSGDIVLWAHCTNPFVEASDYARALSAFATASADGYDSLMSVTRLQSHIWTANKKPLNFEPLKRPHQLASTLEPIFFQDGAIFVQPRMNMVENSYFYGLSPYFFELSGMISFDVNTMDDLALAECIMEKSRRVD